MTTIKDLNGSPFDCAQGMAKAAPLQNVLNRAFSDACEGVLHPSAYAAVTRWIKLSCSLLLSAPMVKASSKSSDSAYLMASLCLLRRSPCPRIFIPTSPLPDDFICLITLITVSGSASMCEPTRLMRTRSTSTHGDFAAARRASIVWHEQPC